MDQQLDLIKKQGKRIALVLIFMSTFYLYDLYDDWQDGEPLMHIVVEMLCVASSLIISAFLWRSSFKSFERSKVLFHQKIDDIQSEAIKWKTDATRLIEGLSLAIDAQFERWKLSPAEKDVALLLLKGCSYNEIAEIRSTTERTIRDQSSAVYQKSKLSGRAQLAAFFLEDLFLPESSTNVSSEKTPIALS